jgi:PAS domain S-box-containing protein
MTVSPESLGTAQYREVFDRVQDIIYVRDLDGVLLDINDAGARFFGRTKENLIGRTLHHTNDDQAARSLRTTNELLLQQGVDRSTVELRNAAGELRIVEATTSIMRDERGVARGAYGVMRDVTESVELQRSLAAANERQTRELEEARLVQLALLPAHVPQLEHLDIAVRMRNATEVGGDYYDFAVADDGALTIAMGDVIGHGFRAGIYGATAKSYFQTLSSAPPREILETMSSAFRNFGIASLYMCLMLVRIRDREASIFGAGMPAFFVRRGAESVDRIEVAGTPLGAQRKPAFEGRVIAFEPGTTMLLFSDGLIELCDEEDPESGEAAILSCLAGAPDETAEETLNRVLAFADARSDGRPPADDVTVMVVRAI